jgi:hypothetical protein
VLVGGGTTLGRWEPANGLPLERSSEGSPLWTAVAELPLGAALQAKVRVGDGVTVIALCDILVFAAGQGACRGR